MKYSNVSDVKLVRRKGLWYIVRALTGTVVQPWGFRSKRNARRVMEIYK